MADEQREQATTVAVVDDGGGEARTRELAGFLGCDVVDSLAGNAGFLVLVRTRSLALSDTSVPGLQPLEVDLSPRPAGRGGDALLRAVGKGCRGVLDLTAGWCGDAAHMAHAGLEVVALERHPLVYVIARDAVDRGQGSWQGGLSLHLGDGADAAQVVERLAGFRPDTVYLDPMYPQKPGSAATRKPLAMLSRITGGGKENDQALFAAARAIARRRVVVKRPHHADALGDGKVGETRTRLVRYDIHHPATEATVD